MRPSHEHISRYRVTKTRTRVRGGIKTSILLVTEKQHPQQQQNDYQDIRMLHSARIAHLYVYFNASDTSPPYEYEYLSSSCFHFFKIKPIPRQKPRLFFVRPALQAVVCVPTRDLCEFGQTSTPARTWNLCKLCRDLRTLA